MSKPLTAEQARVLKKYRKQVPKHKRRPRKDSFDRGLSPLGRATSNTTSIAHQYFLEHPDARDGVMKAYYAYHAGHFRVTPSGHNFLGDLRTSACDWCGRSREQVRHDDLPPQCQNRVELLEIVEVVKSEEEKAFALLNSAEPLVRKIISERGLSGGILAYIRQTHGIDGDFACDILGVCFKLFEQDYLKNQEQHSTLSRSVFKPVIIEVKS